MILLTSQISKSNQYTIAAFEKGYRVKNNKVITSKGKERKLQPNKEGYLYFAIKHEGRVCTVYAHKLKAFEKFGYLLFRENIVVRHLDGDSMNNNDSNIEIGTLVDNTADMSFESIKIRAQKGAAKVRKLSKEDVKSLRKERLEGATYLQIQQKYKLSKSTISYIVNNKTYL